MTLTYSGYLKLDDLLSLQQPMSDGPEHDEMLFIVIHQVYELWFKEILHEIDHLKDVMEGKNTAGVLHTLKRILTIFKVLVHQLDILETMTPLEFLTFRDRLESASGFQSFQFRELEFCLGLKNRAILSAFPEGSTHRKKLEERLHQPSLWDTFLRFLADQGYVIPVEVLNRDNSQPVEQSPSVQQRLIEIYKTDQVIARICELLIDLDEGVQEWRYRHIKAVERTIGNKEGTGGSSGVEYLKKSLFKQAFPDLWAIRLEF